MIWEGTAASAAARAPAIARRARAGAAVALVVGAALSMAAAARAEGDPAATGAAPADFAPAAWVAAHCQRVDSSAASVTLLVRVPDDALGHRVAAAVCGRLSAVARCHGRGEAPRVESATAGTRRPDDPGGPRAAPPPAERTSALQLLPGRRAPVVGEGTLWGGEAACVRAALTPVALPAAAADGRYTARVVLGPPASQREEGEMAHESCELSESWRGAARVTLSGPAGSAAELAALARRACARLPALQRCARRHRDAVGEGGQLALALGPARPAEPAPERRADLGAPAAACVRAAVRGLSAHRTVALGVELGPAAPDRYQLEP